jgi:hypothetical protein
LTGKLQPDVAAARLDKTIRRLFSIDALDDRAAMTMAQAVMFRVQYEKNDHSNEMIDLTGTTRLARP